MIIEKIDTGYEMISNAYLLVDEESKEAAVIDPGAFDERSNLPELVEKHGCTVKYVLLTHGHFDHILGVYPAKVRYGCQVAIGEEDEMCLGDAMLSLAQDNNLDHLQKPCRAEILLKDGDELKLGNHTIKVMATPGHTPGGVCYILEDDRTVFTGDTLFCITVGRTDFPGGSTGQLAESIKKLIALDGDYRILPGHNRETTLDRERAHNRFIRRM